MTVHRPQVPQVPRLFLASPPSKPNVCPQTCETSYTVVMSGFLLCRVDAGHGDDHDDPVDGRWRVADGVLTIRPHPELMP